MPKYEDVYVGIDVNGVGGNAYAIIASVVSGMKSVGAPKSDIEAFRSEAISGDYEHLKEVCSEWVDIEFYGEDFG